MNSGGGLVRFRKQSAMSGSGKKKKYSAKSRAQSLGLIIKIVVALPLLSSESSKGAVFHLVMLLYYFTIPGGFLTSSNQRFLPNY